MSKHPFVQTRSAFKSAAAVGALAFALAGALGALSSARPAAAQTGAASAGPVIKMVTTKGPILIKLYPKDAPISCANFVMLVKKHFYDGLMFHRVTDLGSSPGDGHIIQGGDPYSRHADVAAVKAAAAAQLVNPQAPPAMYQGHAIGNGGSGKEIKGEFPSNGVNNPLTHVAGAVAMARGGDPNAPDQDMNSASSQFYICTTPVHGIDGNYAVFGMVIQGLSNAAKLQVGDRIVKAVVEK